MTNDLKAHGLNYANLGWTIVPVNGKTPLISWGNLKETNPEDVENWFRQFGEKITGFALKTGYVEGVFVLDLESDEDPSRFQIPETVRAKSGGGGMHYYFSKVGKDIQEAGGINLRKYDISGDFRGDGSLIVLPPSIHPKTGNAYEWIVELDDELLAEAPEWLCKIVTENQHKKVDWDAVVAEPVEKGSRHSVATSIAGKILHHFPVSDWNNIGYTLLNSWNNTQCVEPLGQSEIDNIFHGLQKKQLAQHKEENEVPSRKPLSIKDLYELSESQRPEFLIEGIIPEDSITVIGGHPGSGKSWIMLEIARAVATGTKFVNEFESKQKAVLIVDEENGFWEMRRRLESLGFDKDSSLHFCCQYEFKLDEKESLNELLNICKEKSIGLIILDPLANLHSKDENSAKDMQIVLAALQKFNQIGVTVIFVHHHRKGGFGSNGQNLRGSSAIHGRADSVLVVEKNSNDEPLTMTVKHVKSRKGKPANTSQIILLEDTSVPPIKLVYGGNTPNSILKRTTAREYVIKLLETNEMFRKEIIDTIQSEEDIGERNIIGALSELEAEKVIYSKRINREKQYFLTVP